ncbi:acetyltransferase [Colletotrichum plurivorum]|uniref:Acetyltransferase n=1 Tax=Colletotrichum plurivorum TaxID=2175906 RepID=A0A8H6JLG1_9PEZI|nr:acetyltransferase [Colletotrichum plurivorum]
MSAPLHPHGTSSISISLLPVAPDDVATLVDVHAAAFRSDQFSNLMLLNRDQNAHQALMLKSIQQWISAPAAKLTKAVDDEGQIVGWSCWISKGTDTPDDSVTTPQPVAEKKPEDVQKREPKTKPPQQQPAQQQDPSRALGGLMYKDMVSMEAKHLSGKRYMVLQALATDPKYQSRGVATKLVKNGLEAIDSEGLPCWIHASPSSYAIYEKAGFEEVGKSVYDLAEWAPGGKDGNRGWGDYAFRYMLRPAQHGH